MRKMFVAAMLLVPASLWASGGHYPVDDSVVGEPGDFVVESWVVYLDSDNRELAVLPTLTLGGQAGRWAGLGAVDLTGGIYRIEEDGERFTRFEPAVKYRLPWSADMADMGVTAAVSFTAGFDDGRLEDWLLNVPLTFASVDAWSVHANVGWLRLRDRADGSADRLLLGLGGEFQVSEAVDVIAQIYREGAHEQPGAQLGVRFAGGSVVEVVDLAVGRVLRGDDQDWFVTVGVGF